MENVGHPNIIVMLSVRNRQDLTIFKETLSSTLFESQVEARLIDFECNRLHNLLGSYYVAHNMNRITIYCFFFL